MVTDANTQDRVGGVALVAALLVVAVWIGLLIWLIAHSETTEIIWARWLTVMTSLEAVAFAAAGAVFGTTVQRQRVAEAKARVAESDKRAAKAERDSDAKSKDAANGRSLATIIKTKGRKRKLLPAEGFQSAAAAVEEDDDDLVAIAERMFPD